MERKGKISDYRSRLDKTLASPDLTNDEMVHTLVKNQILRSSNSQLEECSEYVVERRSKEVSDFLNELRSASVKDVERSKSSDESHGGWKVKQDTDELRVMYREGPEGTPFHTLLVESFVDGPVDVCLCISCESDLYKKWWPQISIPTFRVVSSQGVQRVRMGEQISIVRMKVPWPMSSREALVHYFTFEYFQDGLVVVLLKSISDLENIDRTMHGFTRDGIPEARDVVRLDLYGGFALQKVTANRSYFRTIANMDIKMPFVPPAIINFIARQLVGSGFKLYTKEVASVSKGDGKFGEALKDTLYTRVHEALYSQNASNASPALDNTRSTSIMLEEQSSEALEDNSAKENNECESIMDSEAKDVGVRDKSISVMLEEQSSEAFKDTSAKENNECDSITDSEAKDVGVTERKVLNEIEEFEEKDSGMSESLHEGTQKSRYDLTDEITEEVRTNKTEAVNSTEVEVEVEVERDHEITEHLGYDIKTKAGISPEVQQALLTLERAISIFREYNSNPGKDRPDVKKESSLSLKDDAGEESISFEADETRKNETCVEPSKIESAELTSQMPRNSSDNHGSRHKGSNSFTRETNQSKIAPASPDEGHSSPSNIKHIDVLSTVNQKIVSTVSQSITDNHSLGADANSINGNRVTKKKYIRSRFCCLSFASGQVE